MAYTFNGTSSKIDYGDIADGFGGGKMSISVRAHSSDWTQSNTEAGMVNKRAASNSQASYSFGFNFQAYVGHYGEIGMEVGQVGSSMCAYNADISSIPDNSWVQWLGTYNKDNANTERIKLYANASALPTTVAIDAAPTIPNAASNLVLGRMNQSGSLFFNGMMAEVAIWSAELSAAEATALQHVSPLLIRPRSLVFYDGLGFSLQDRVTGTIPTNTAATRAAGPFVAGPHAPIITGPAAAGGGSSPTTFVPYASSLHPMNPLTGVA